MVGQLVACLGIPECAVLRELLEKEGMRVIFDSAFTVNDLHDDIILAEASGVLVSGHVRLPEADIRKFRKLRMIVIMAVGHDKIDSEAAGRMGIPVSTMPACTLDEVSDSALSHILNLYRRTHQLAKNIEGGSIYKGSPKLRAEMKGVRRISGQTLGIIGFGNIGRGVAMRAKAFGFKIAFYDPYIKPGIEKVLGAHKCYKIDELLQISDCITLHCNLTKSNHHIINADSIKLMKDGAFIVNTARGGLIDENALAGALKSRKLGGAGLDVHEIEPFDYLASKFRDVPNVICTPHSSWYSDDSDYERRETCAEEMVRGLHEHDLEDLHSLINGEYLKVVNGAA